MSKQFYFTIDDREIVSFDRLDECIDAMVASVRVGEPISHYAYDRHQDLIFADVARMYPVTDEMGESTGVVSLVVVRIDGETFHYYPNAYRPIACRRV